MAPVAKRQRSRKPAEAQPAEVAVAVSGPLLDLMAPKLPPVAKPVAESKAALAVRPKRSGARTTTTAIPAVASDSWAAALLLQWYDRERRDLPWRSDPGLYADPYHVWLSEMMLQQTTVKAVIPYYHRFLERFPTIKALAKAQEDDILKLWAGLGY